MISRVSISSPDVVGAGEAAPWPLYGLTTARTFNLAMVYFISLPQK
jgi:hypothetical protein